MLFVSIIEYNEIIFNPVNELSSQKQLWKKKSKGWKRPVMEKRKGMFHLSFCYWHFLCDTLCVLVFHADLKPLLWGAYVKDRRPPDVMPPGSPHSSPHHSYLLTCSTLVNPLWLCSSSALSFLYSNQARPLLAWCHPFTPGHVHISTHVHISLFTPPFPICSFFPLVFSTSITETIKSI